MPPRDASHRRFVQLLAAALTALSARARAQDVVINEIHYDPADRTAGEEFIELHNPGASEADLSGCFFSSGVDMVFPEGTRIPGGAYLVVAEDPVGFRARFGRPADLGPWQGRLDGQGERVALRDRSGRLIDEVEYAVRFPWPLACAGDGSSMELIHPSLDNDLGGSWRASGMVESGSTPVDTLVPAMSPGWKYRKGLSEASSPADRWRAIDFVEDASWLSGTAGFGFADDDDATVLADMRGQYSSVYLRHAFQVDDLGSLPSLLRLRTYVDDGCIVWINGREVARVHVVAGDIAHDGVGLNHEAEWEEFVLPSTSSVLRAGTNVLAVHALNSGINSTDFSIDVELLVGGVPPSGPGDPTPGARNSVFSTTAPPQVREVAHGPFEPPSGSPIVVTAKVTDPEGVARVAVSYQVVAPGDYIPAFLPLPYSTLLAQPYRARDPNPEFEDPASWTTIEMRDDGRSGDQGAGDDVYTAILPAQSNRTLVRYRLSVRDATGAEATVPYRDDPSLNFACFVHDGVPPYRITARTVHPAGVGHEYASDLMRSLPVYFLITREAYLVEAIAPTTATQIPQGSQARFVENWEGAFVYDGHVYDHITYRLRGANGRYQVPPTNPADVAGKRHWRFKFNRGNHLRVRDRFGQLLPFRWRVLNTCRMFGNRLDGNWGLPDQVNDLIWNAHAVPSPLGHSFHWRVIDGPDEAPAGTEGQYLGDFWGIERAFQNYDVRFLDTHGLPKGNLYKLVNQTNDAIEQLRYQAPDAVSDGSDHDNIENNLRSTQPDAWLLAHVNYEEWYRYHAIAQALRHYDYWPEANKNAAWYFEPVYEPANGFLGRMWTLPFDADATWGPTWNEGKDRPWDAIYGGAGKPSFQRDYRNAIREVRDLLWQPDQLATVIRQTASFLDGLEEPDIDRWRLAPAAAGRQHFSSVKEATLEGKIKDMLDFAFVGGTWAGGGVGAGGRAAFLDGLADGPDRTSLPSKPTIAYVGDPGYPADGLAFGASDFSDPQGPGTFGGMEWRLAEVSGLESPGSIPLSDPVWKAGPAPLELTPVWTSVELATYEKYVAFPAAEVQPGRRYRARVRMKDSTGIWSHWSDPVEFTAAPPLDRNPAVSSLRITEIHFNPIEGSDLEFVEVANVGRAAIALDGVTFTSGIELSFAGTEAPVLGAGEYAVLVKDRRSFEARYGASTARIVGVFQGSLSNGGERLVLSFGGYDIVHDFEYRDDWYPRTDGLGPSLEIRDPSGPIETWASKDGWFESSVSGGTPGSPPIPPEAGGLQLPSDANQDGRADISDAISLLGTLFLGSSGPPPCGGESPSDGGNLELLDGNGDDRVDLSDAVFLLSWLFQGGGPPVRGTACIRIAGCPDVCGN